MDKTYILTVDKKLSLTKFAGRLAPTHTLSITGPEHYHAVLLDTFDSELAQADKLLFESDGELLLIDTAKAAIFSQSGQASGRCIDEIKQGAVQSQLDTLSKLRALCPITALEYSTETACMLDDESKTVARLQGFTFKHKKYSATIIIARSLRGYETEFELLTNSLKNIADNRATSLGRILKLNISSYNPKPDIALNPADPIYQSANTIITTFIKVARQNEAGIIDDIDTEFLHDYRVSLRKVRSVISLFKGVYSSDEAARLKNEFASLMQITGRLRDLDVYLLERNEYYALVPPSTHGGIDVMFDTFTKERAQLHKNIKNALKSKQYKNRIGILCSECADQRWEKGESGQQPTRQFGCSAILKRYNKVCRIARTIDSSTPDDTVHELRIHCKKLRYLMEFFTPLFDSKEIKTLIKSLKILQDNLGKFNDFSVQQVSLADFLSSFPRTDKNSIKVAESIGGLIAMLNYLQKKEKEQVMANFALFDSEETRTLFNALFSTRD